MSNDLWGPMFFKGACNSLKASRWQLLKARLLGQRHEGSDGKQIAVGYYYKGNFYLWDYSAALLQSREATNG